MEMTSRNIQACLDRSCDSLTLPRATFEPHELQHLAEFFSRHMAVATEGEVLALARCLLRLNSEVVNRPVSARERILAATLLSGR